MKYLKDKQYYIDRYDLLTINKCLKIVEMYQEVYDKSLTSEAFKGMSKHDKYSDVTKLLHWQLSFFQAQEYKKKKEIIRKWMDEDQIKQDNYDTVVEPQNISCPSCNADMKATETKHLEDFMDHPMRVMFIFRCTKCKKQEWVYENGEIRVSKPNLCPKCNKEIEVTHKEAKKGKVITWTRNCKSCGHTETEVENFEKSHQEYLQKEQADKVLLELHRPTFCLSDEEGEKYLFEIEAMEFADQIQEEARQKYDNNAYQKVSKLKKITISELEKLLTETLEKEKYIKFSISSPEIGQFIFAPFTLQDADTSRRDNMSTSSLEKLLKNTLENTNWRLVDKVSYRLGFLSGRLKGYERENDLIQLYEKKKEPQKLIDPEKRLKYSTSTWVKLAEIKGQHEGIEASRKKRLEKEPEGFFLEADGYYNCVICDKGHYGNETWWNLDGVYCTDCWRNIKEGFIPHLKKNNFNNEDEWISNYHLKNRHNILPSTARKLRREGLLHGRDLRSADGSVYKTIYLLSENQEFLKKYPRKKEKENPNINTLDIFGHAVKIGEVPSEDKPKK